MNSKSDEGVGGFIRSYADRVRADALEKAAELTGAVPPPWATGTPSMSRPLDLPPPPAPSAPSSPEPGKPVVASPPSLESPVAARAMIDTEAEVEAAPASTPSAPEGKDRAEPGPPKSDRSKAVVPGDETAIEDEDIGDIETAVDDAPEVGLPPLPDIDHVLDGSSVADLEEIVNETRDELRQWKRELRRARRDVRRRQRYDRRFGPG